MILMGPFELEIFYENHQQDLASFVDSYMFGFFSWQWCLLNSVIVHIPF